MKLGLINSVLLCFVLLMIILPSLFSLFSTGVSQINSTTIETRPNTVTIHVGKYPIYLAFSKWNNGIYVTNSGDNYVDLINGSTNTVVKKIDVGYPTLGIAYDSSNRNMYVVEPTPSLSQLNNVSVISTSSNKLIAVIPNVGNDSEAISYDPFNKELYVMNYYEPTVSVIDAKTNRVITRIDIGGSPGVFATYNPFNHDMYVTASYSVFVIDSKTNSVVDTISFPITMQGVAYDPHNHAIYVAGYAGYNELYEINSSTNQVVGSVHLKNGAAYAVAYDSKDGNIYVSLFFSKYVQVVTPNLKIVKTVLVGQEPSDFAFDNRNGHMYVTNFVSSTVTVL